MNARRIVGEPGRGESSGLKRGRRKRKGFGGLLLDATVNETTGGRG